MMLGLGSVEIALAFWLVIFGAAVCIGYGGVKWNQDGRADTVDPQQDEEQEEPAGQGQAHWGSPDTAKTPGEAPDGEVSS